MNMWAAEYFRSSNYGMQIFILSDFLAVFFFIYFPTIMAIRSNGVNLENNFKNVGNCILAYCDVSFQIQLKALALWLPLSIVDTRRGLTPQAVNLINRRKMERG